MFRPALTENNSILIEWAPGDRRPLLADGQPLAPPDDGHVPHQFYTGLAFRMLELRHPSGAVATWFFTEELELLAKSASLLPEDRRLRLEPFARHALDLLWSGLIVGSRAGESTDFQDMLRLSANSRHQLMALCDLGAMEDATHIYTADLPGQDEVCLEARGGRALRVRPPVLAALLSTDMIELSRQASATGSITVPSPFSGDLCTTDTSLCATEIIYWYPFRDPSSGIDFFCIASLHHCRIVAVYVPGHDVVVMAQPIFRSMLEQMFGGSLKRTMLRHLAGYATEMWPYLALKTRKLTLLYGEEHLGHHLWNELSGLEGFLRQPFPGAVPSVIEMSPNSEMFGALDQLFPELAGRLTRHYGRRELLLSGIYTDALFIVRVTGLQVPVALQERLAAFTLQQSYIEAEQTELARIQGANLPVIAFALRPENRTLVDPVPFFMRCAEHIRAQIGPVCIVIEGHALSMSGEGAIRRSNEDASVTSTAAAEFRLAGELSGHLSAAGFEVVVSVGKPIGVNLFWLRQAAFFIGSWGTGLAKSRWAVNTPGIVLSNGPNLHHSDLHLYDSPGTNEQPSPMLIVGKECIIDRPDTPTLVPGPADLGANFDIRFPEFLSYIDRMIGLVALPTLASA